MRRVWWNFISIFAMLAAHGAAPSSAQDAALLQQCYAARPGAPVIQVELHDPDVPVRRVPAASLQELGVEHGHGGGGLILGAARSRIDLTYEIAVRGVQSPRTREFCVLPERITMVLAFAQHDVLIAEELPHGSCTQMETYHHEARHVAVNRQAAQNMVARLRHSTQAWADRAIAVHRGRDAAVAALQAELQSIATQIRAMLDSELLAGHRAIDHPGESARINQACNGETAEIVRSLRRHLGR